MFSLTPYELNVTARNALGAASGALSFLLENISECCRMGTQGSPAGASCLTLWGSPLLGMWDHQYHDLLGLRLGPVPNNPMLDPAATTSPLRLKMKESGFFHAVVGQEGWF